MSHKIKAWVSVGLTISMMILLLSPLQRAAAAEENTEKASGENFISMDAFCALNPEEQNDQLVDIASVDDLDKLRTYLDTNPIGGANTFRQTADIVVSPYTYEYLEDAHRIKISYDGAVEAYYDVTDGKYYEEEQGTSKIAYNWKVESMETIGGYLDSSQKSTWSYLGNNHTIEGVYQEMDPEKGAMSEVYTDDEMYPTGLFRYASKISGINVKNFFLIGGGAALGSHFGDVKDCKGEAIQIVMLPSIMSNGGFISRPEGNVENVQVDINLFYRDDSVSDEEEIVFTNSNQNIGGIIDSPGYNTESCVIRDCTSSGLIWSVKGTGFTAGGIAGDMEGVKKAAIVHCSSNIKVAGEIIFAGGIAGLYSNDMGHITDCAYEGTLRIYCDRKHQAEWQFSYPCAGGICGQMGTVGMIIGCQNKAEIKSAIGNAGGIVGYTDGGGIVNCANYGDVITQRAPDDLWKQPAGGIVGAYAYQEDSEYTERTMIVNCYNAGDITSENSVASGIVGLFNHPLIKCPKQVEMEIQNVCSTGTVHGAVEKDYLTGIISEGVSRAYDGRGADLAKLCEQLNRTLFGANVTGGYEWDDMDSFRSNAIYGYDTVYHSYPQTGKCLRTKWSVTDEGTLDLQVVYEQDLDVIDLVVAPTVAPTKAPTKTPTSPSAGKKPSATTPSQNLSTKKSGGINSSKSSTASGSSGKAVWKAPTFSLKRKKTSSGQRYILLTLRKYQGTHIEVWVKIGTGRYKKIKLSQNKVKKLHGKLKFRYSFTRKTLYFKVRTYQKKKSKTSYSVKSKAKRIVAK